MASRAERTRNNIKAGIFVTVGITLAFVVIVILSDATKLLEPRTKYVLSFPLSTGVDGLAPGSPVRVGGLQRGQVDWVAPEIDGGVVRAIRVGIELDKDIVLREDARPERVTQLLGGLGAINFADIGDPATSPPLPAGGVIEVSASGAGPLARFIGAPAARSFEQILRNVDETTAMIRADYPRYVESGLKRFDQIMADAQEFVASVKSDGEQWRSQITTTLARVERASGELGPLFEKGDKFIDNASARIDDVGALIAENRPGIDQIVENVRVATADVRVIADRARTEWMDRVDRVLADGQQALDAFRTVAQRAGEEIDAISPSLERTVADAAQTAQQLKLASIEVRRAPWRLLYRPSDRELDHELLYDAARSFALAAGDLRGTAETVDRVLTRNAEFLQGDPARAERIRALLGDSLQRYEQAQERLFTILANEP